MVEHKANRLDVKDLLIGSLFAELGPESGREVIIELCHRVSILPRGKALWEELKHL